MNPRDKMREIKKLTNVIRNYSEVNLDYGTLRTLKMIDNIADTLLDLMQPTVYLPKKKETKGGECYVGYNRFNLDDEWNQVIDTIKNDPRNGHIDFREE